LADIVAGFELAAPDAELLDGLRAGSQDAFASLLDTYQRPIYNFVYRMLEDPEDAPDVTQEVFLKVFRNIARFRGDCSLKTWLYRISVNEAFNRRRWFQRHRQQETPLEERSGTAPSIADQLADPQEDQFDMLLRRERLQVVERALAEVPDSFRVAVVMRDIQGLSYEEIADALAAPVGTVKSRILRGREALKQKLAVVAAGRPVAALRPAIVD